MLVGAYYRRIEASSEASVLARQLALFDGNGTWHIGAVRLAGVGGVAINALGSAALAVAAEAFRAAGGADCGVCCSLRIARLRSMTGRLAPVRGERCGATACRRLGFAVLQALMLELKLAPWTGVLDLCGLPW